MSDLEQTALELLKNYGWQVFLIAIVGVIILGVLKYLNVFEKIEEKYRHYIYLSVSVGFSILASVIYLACSNQLSGGTLFAIASVMFALNQGAYAIYANTPLKELLHKLLSKGADKLKEVEGVPDEIVDAVKEKGDKLIDEIKEIK